MCPATPEMMRNPDGRCSGTSLMRPDGRTITLCTYQMRRFEI